MNAFVKPFLIISIILGFLSSLWKHYYYWRPIGDPSETDMPHWKPTCLIGDQHTSSETHWRLTCLIWDQHCTAETHGRPTCLMETHKNTYLAQGWSPFRHVGLWWDLLVSDQSCWFPIRHVGLRWGMSVSNRSLMRHVGLWQVSNQASWSPIGLQ